MKIFRAPNRLLFIHFNHGIISRASSNSDLVFNSDLNYRYHHFGTTDIGVQYKHGYWHTGTVQWKWQEIALKVWARAHTSIWLKIWQNVS
jgi:hypothetical protein